MSNIDIKEIEEKLNQRLYYQDKKYEDEYESKVNVINEKYKDKLWYDHTEKRNTMDTELNDLMKKKLMDIRKKLNDDEGFHKIKAKLQHIENMITEKEGELDLLKVPKSSHFLQRAYTKVTGNKNTADIENDEFYKKRKGVDSELITLNTIKNNIQKLIPIYRSKEDTRNIELQKKDIYVSTGNAVIGKKYKIDDNIVTLNDKSYSNDKTTVTLTFDDNTKMNSSLNYQIIEVAQEGGKRKTRRQRKSRKARRRVTSRRR